MTKEANWRSRTGTTFQTHTDTHTEKRGKSPPNNGLEDPILVVNHCVGIMYQKCYCIIISVHQVIASVFTCTGYCISRIAS